MMEWYWKFYLWKLACLFWVLLAISAVLLIYFAKERRWFAKIRDRAK